MYGLYFCKKKQYIDNQTTIDHKKPNCNSNEIYKRPKAQKINAFQINRNLLISSDAKINTIPQLEIWANNVKCSHGVTIGKLNEDQLFYLKTRGIKKEIA